VSCISNSLILNRARVRLRYRTRVLFVEIPELKHCLCARAALLEFDRHDVAPVCTMGSAQGGGDSFIAFTSAAVDDGAASARL
jgi:hypothetical protein